MRLILLIIFLFIVNCKFNKVVDTHGIHYLDKKNKELVVNSSNKNDIIKAHPVIHWSIIILSSQNILFYLYWSPLYDFLIGIFK